MKFPWYLTATTVALAPLAFSTSPPPISTLTPAQTDVVTKAAASYLAHPYSLVNPEPDRSPVDCRAPVFTVGPSKSTGQAEDGHGKKLYYLYAKDLEGYRVGTGLFRDWSQQFPGVQAKPRELTAAEKRGEQNVGQVIIKESWTDLPVAEGAKVRSPPPGVDALLQTRGWFDGAPHDIGDKSALFIMAKVAEAGTEGTDNGWVYATTTADGKAITSGGLLPKCMGCHVKAPHDRLFGPKEQ